MPLYTLELDGFQGKALNTCITAPDDFSAQSLVEINEGLAKAGLIVGSPVLLPGTFLRVPVSFERWVD